MVLFIEPQPTIGEAWARTLEGVTAAGGSAVHVVTTITDPAGRDDSKLRGVADRYLVERYIGNHHVQTVQTVANTIFPKSFYRSPGYSWAPELKGTEEETALNAAADELYARYNRNLPHLRQFNKTGTYFQRMIAWDNKKGQGYNQVAARIKKLRSDRSQNWSTSNAADLAVAGDGELEAAGLQTFASTDERTRGFPCLVHVDLTVRDKTLHVSALYRHQYLITKAYGNALGLARLQAFIAEQTGYAVGELTILGTYSDTESRIWTKAGVREILADLRDAGAA
ncbi:hypothetical protein [Curtobacterium sp. PhB136]|uniref:hypothetical protein n=1 Tax=Curtobacterium sp. PhB136 TaxID=2485181 RepID=UPI00105294EB|nr:hypothetical protein [Curtobacterium sp. PhB136]TCK65834.1 hypothetical protein EDF27_0577 [Curtobacterium sp. PhB136]